MLKRAVGERIHLWDPKLKEREKEEIAPVVTPGSGEGSRCDVLVQSSLPRPDPPRPDLLAKCLLLIVLLLVSWVVMCTTHECGHLLGGWLGGGTLQRAELRPWKLPYSLFNPDPRPLVTLWMGPLFGAVLPVILALILRHRWIWFVAWFCMLANGAYLATAWYSGDALLDTNRMFAAGASRSSVAAFIAISLVAGYPKFRRACQIEWENETLL